MPLVGLISDIHDNPEGLDWAPGEFRSRDTETATASPWREERVGDALRVNPGELLDVFTSSPAGARLYFLKRDLARPPDRDLHSHDGRVG